MSLAAWVRERTGGARAPVTVPRASWAYVLGWTLVMLLALQAVTGAALAAFYAPTSTDAWASVAYVQDRMTLGWLVRGLHHHGASALVIVAGIHLLQTALFGAYKRPRELVWWLGIVLLALVMAFAITGYVLRWDQAGFWANQVEVGIAAGTPIVGDAMRAALLGGNDYGNLTLTRFYALHVLVLPALFVVLAVAHVVLSRRLGLTPRGDRADAKPVPRWPAQSLRDVIAMAAAFAALLGYTLSTSGVELMAPADPAVAFDARPLWYVRWLFQLRAMFGSLEQVAAMVAPAIVAGYLVALPLVDRSPAKSPWKIGPWVGGVVGLFVVIGALTAASLVRDANDDGLQKRLQAATQRASRLRALAAEHGVPAIGPHAIEAQSIPFYQARTLFEQRCADCHAIDSKDRKGPIITAGHHSRAWLKAFLKDPNGDAFWGRTKLAKTEDAMKAVELPDAQIDEVVELLYAQSGARDVDTAKAERGKAVYDTNCNDCHSLDEGVAGGQGPGLAALASRDWFTSFIGNPKAAIHMTADKSEMPRFDKELTLVERDALAEYLVWLRTATQRDVDALGPL